MRRAAVMALAALLATAPGPVRADQANALPEAIATYNALPDTHSPLALYLAAPDKGTIDAPLPSWPLPPRDVPRLASNLPLTRDEANALVALAGAYLPMPGVRTVARPAHYSLPAWVAGAVAMVAVNDRMARAGVVERPDFSSPPLGLRRHPVPEVPEAERFDRTMQALESCPAAFAALALKIHAAAPGGALDRMAVRARTDHPALAVPPAPTCS